MIYAAIGAGALGAIILGAAALIPSLGGTLRKAGYGAGAVLIAAGIGLFFWPTATPEAPQPTQKVVQLPAIPPPGGELSKFTNDELVEGARVLVQVISDYDKANENASLETRQKDYTARFAKPVRDMTAELNARVIGGLSVPPTGEYLIAYGLIVAVSGKLDGPDPLIAVCNFLLNASLQVPTIAKPPQ